jgi:hypothetical protein
MKVTVGSTITSPRVEEMKTRLLNTAAKLPQAQRAAFLTSMRDRFRAQAQANRATKKPLDPQEPSEPAES